MGLPWIQMASEVIEQGASDLAVMLDWDEAQAGWGMTKLFNWALKRADPKRPPSHSDTVRGPSAAKLVARAALWTGDPDTYIEACEHLPKPVVERMQDGSIRIHGLDRYDRAWKKGNPDLWKTLQAESGTKQCRESAGKVPEPGTKPAPNSAGKVPGKCRESAGLPPQDRDRDRDRELNTLSAHAREPVNPNDTLRDAVERVWEQWRGVRPRSIADHDLRTAFEKADGDAKELLRVLAAALQKSYPKLARFTDLVKFWDDYAATKGPEPARPKSQHARATNEDKFGDGYSPPLLPDGSIDLLGVGS